MKRQSILAVSLAILMTTGSLPAAVIANLDISTFLHSRKQDARAVVNTAAVIPGPEHWRSDGPFNSTNISHDGDIRVSEDDRSVESISPGGYLKISIRTFGNSRELLINSDSRGNLSYEFREGRQEIPYEPEGRRWLAEVLPDVIRSSGIDAERRALRIYARGGIDGFLDEISKIPGNTVMALYFSALLDQQTLNDGELEKLIYAIAGKMSSDTERGRLFREYQDSFLRNAGVATDYFSAISRLSSSSEKGRIYREIDQPLDFTDRQMTDAYFAGIDRISSSTEAGSALRHTIATHRLTDYALGVLLRSTAKVSSSTESGRVLRTFTEINLDDPSVRESFFAAVDHLSSSTEAGSVLRDVLRKNKVDGASMVALLNSTRKIPSSTESGSVVRTISSINLADAQIREAYFNVIRTNPSTTESGRMLRYTLDNHKLGRESLINLFETTSRISSSTEVSSVLRASVPHLIYEDPVLDAFFSCTARISSSTEQGRVLRTLAAAEGLNPKAVKGILICARAISSSTEKGSVLRAVAPKIKGDHELRDVYMDTAKTLGSDSEYRRAVEAIM